MTSWRVRLPLYREPIKRNDLVILVNERLACGLKRGDREKMFHCKNKDYYYLRPTDIDSSLQWFFEFYETNKKNRYRLRASEVKSQAEDYLGWTDDDKCSWARMFEAKDESLLYFTLPLSTKEEVPHYGVPYNIHNDKGKMILTINEEREYAEAIKIGITRQTDKWVFLPVEKIKRLNIPPSCYYLRNYNIKYSKYADVQHVREVCSDRLNDYCREISNDAVFDKEREPCYDYMKANPKGKADGLIKRVCSRDENENRPECACIYPLQFGQKNSEFPDYETAFSCFATHCIKNKGTSFLLRKQTTQCPDIAICYTEDIDGSKPILKISEECVIGEDPRAPTNRRREKEEEEELIPPYVAPILLIGGTLLLIIIIWLIYRRITRKPKPVLPVQEEYVIYPPYQ